MLYLLNAINCDVFTSSRSFSLSKVLTAEYKSGNSREKYQYRKALNYNTVSVSQFSP